MDTETGTTDSQTRPEELAERCLRSNSYSYPALKSVSCEYLIGVLVLRGSVPTYYLKQLAQTVIAQLDGIKRIDNQIEVVTSAM
jgi:hypothetical protein